MYAIQPAADVTMAVGQVPTVRLNRLTDICKNYEMFLKLECCNPGGSIKEKNACYLVKWAEECGLLREGGTIVESSSGNFGIGLAIVGACRGYRVVIVVDAKTPMPVRRMMRAYGAELVEVPLSECDASGSMQKARMRKAQSLTDSISGAWYPCQHLNPANTEAHAVFTAREIEASFGDTLDAIIIGVSTAGQIMGIAKHFKRYSPKTHIVGVDVQGSVIFKGPGHPYKMTGVGLSFDPPCLDRSLLDACFVVHETLGYSMCHALARREGLLLGSSTGIIVAAGLRYALALRPGSRILMINPDRGDRYLETIYDENWLRENGFELIAPDDLESPIRQLEPILFEHSSRASETLSAPVAL